MNAIKATAIEQLISQLDAQILAIERLGIPGTKLLLTMARLDLQAKRYNIRDSELKVLCMKLECALSGVDQVRHQPERRPGRRPRARAKPVRHAGNTALTSISSGQPRSP
jgi:hypothetical protein